MQGMVILRVIKNGVVHTNEADRNGWHNRVHVLHSEHKPENNTVNTKENNQNESQLDISP